MSKFGSVQKSHCKNVVVMNIAEKNLHFKTPLQKNTILKNAINYGVFAAQHYLQWRFYGSVYYDCVFPEGVFWVQPYFYTWGRDSNVLLLVSGFAWTGTRVDILSSNIFGNSWKFWLTNLNITYINKVINFPEILYLVR